ncbi:MAG: hypothetical protein FWE06_03235 [Oscillospiraceae bacterium]|nr:hypothetical protein [Oscillospiraceae bacterium]
MRDRFLFLNNSEEELRKISFDTNEVMYAVRDSQSKRETALVVSDRNKRVSIGFHEEPSFSSHNNEPFYVIRNVAEIS